MEVNDMLVVSVFLIYFMLIRQGECLKRIGPVGIMISFEMNIEKT